MLDEWEVVRSYAIIPSLRRNVCIIEIELADEWGKLFAMTNLRCWSLTLTSHWDPNTEALFETNLILKRVLILILVVVAITWVDLKEDKYI